MGRSIMTGAIFGPGFDCKRRGINSACVGAPNDSRNFFGFIKRAVGIANSVFGGNSSGSRAGNIPASSVAAANEASRLARELASVRAANDRERAASAARERDRIVRENNARAQKRLDDQIAASQQAAMAAATVAAASKKQTLLLAAGAGVGVLGLAFAFKGR